MSATKSDIQVLQHIVYYCDRVQEILAEFSRNYLVFTENKTYQDAIGMNLLQVGELVSHLSQGYKDETAKKIPWRSIKQMRNIYAHNYGSIQFELAWEAATMDTPQLKAFCEAEISAYDQPSVLEKSE